MKARQVIFLMVFGLLSGMSLISKHRAQHMRGPSSEKSNSTVACHIMTTDFGEIVGRGKDRNAAMADAAEKCYMRRESQFEAVRQKRIDKTRGEDLIISCINIPCRFDVADR